MDLGRIWHRDGASDRKRGQGPWHVLRAVMRHGAHYAICGFRLDPERIELDTQEDETRADQSYCRLCMNQLAREGLMIL